MLEITAPNYQAQSPTLNIFINKIRVEIVGEFDLAAGALLDIVSPGFIGLGV